MSLPVERPPSLLALPSYLAAHVAKGLRAEVQHVLLEQALETPHHGVLVALGDYGVLSQQQLADRLDADKSQVVRLIDQLERRDLLTRSPDPSDRRRHRVELTAAGRETLRQVKAAVEETEKTYLAALSKADRRILITLLRRVLDSRDRNEDGQRANAASQAVGA